MTRSMLAVALLVLAYIPRAHAADDAPVVAVTEQVADVKCYDAAQRANIARALVAKDAEIASLRKDAGLPVAVVVGLIVAGVVAGGAAGYGIAVATKAR